MSLDRGIDPAQAFAALQQFAANEVSRFYAEISLRDACIQQLDTKIYELEEKIKELETKFNG